MSETALTPLFYQGVSRELQDMLLHNPAPSHDFHAFSNHLHVLDNRYRRHQQQALRNRATQPTRNTNSPNTTTPARPSQVLNRRVNKKIVMMVEVLIDCDVLS